MPKKTLKLSAKTKLKNKTKKIAKIKSKKEISEVKIISENPPIICDPEAESTEIPTLISEPEVESAEIPTLISEPKVENVKTPTLRENSKMSKIIALIGDAEDGITLKRLSEELKWQLHTTRSALSRLNTIYKIEIESSKLAGSDRVYKLPKKD